MLHCAAGIISSWQSAATSQIVKRFELELLHVSITYSKYSEIFSRINVFTLYESYKRYPPLSRLQTLMKVLNSSCHWLPKNA